MFYKDKETEIKRAEFIERDKETYLFERERERDKETFLFEREREKKKIERHINV